MLKTLTPNTVRGLIDLLAAFEASTKLLPPDNEESWGNISNGIPSTEPFAIVFNGLLHGIIKILKGLSKEQLAELLALTWCAAGEVPFEAYQEVARAQAQGETVYDDLLHTALGQNLRNGLKMIRLP